jgi:hypothetical protein
MSAWCQSEKTQDQCQFYLKRQLSEVKYELDEIKKGREATGRFGHWTELHQNCNGYGVIHYFHKECSENGNRLLSSPYPYCPSCGAKMISRDADAVVIER